MARTVKEAQLGNRTARARLKSGRQPHWRSLAKGMTIGWQRWKGDRTGRWILRRHVGPNKYTSITLGHADDAEPANGETVLSYEQAEARARSLVEVAPAQITNLTVRQALARYVEWKRGEGRPVKDELSRGAVHILPTLGDLVVAEMTTDILRRWLTGMANAPAQTRPRKGKPRYRAAPEDDDAIRARRASANRTLAILRAALNHAYRDGHTPSADAWGRRLVPFKGTNTARIRFLSVAEAARLINAADPEFRPLCRAALETGCRYGELTRLQVQDFNPDAGTLAIRRSKSGMSRHVILTPEGAAFFKQHCAGRPGHELVFRHPRGDSWGPSDQKRPMAAAVENAKITPRISFHGLRHTYASLSVMAGVPLVVIARALGHSNTKMVEHHYGHLAEDYISEAIRSGAPRYYGVTEPKAVVPMR